MPTYSYDCRNCNKTHDMIRKINDRANPGVCPHCGGKTQYVISAPRVALDGTDPSFPGAWHSWEKKREQKMKQERKCFDNHGTET